MYFKKEEGFKDAIILGTVTFLIGSALMFIPFKGIWWAYVGTFLVGFIGFYGLRLLRPLHGTWVQGIQIR
jgi:hypothetical protein|tara:strand:+ start:370 stop:579 length:210 start_codon:yes stop_codon:yes gene_type:complete